MPRPTEPGELSFKYQMSSPESVLDPGSGEETGYFDEARQLVYSLLSKYPETDKAGELINRIREIYNKGFLVTHPYDKPDLKPAFVMYKQLIIELKKRNKLTPLIKDEIKKNMERGIDQLKTYIEKYEKAGDKKVNSALEYLKKTYNDMF